MVEVSSVLVGGGVVVEGESDAGASVAAFARAPAVSRRRVASEKMILLDVLILKDCGVHLIQGRAKRV